jgi:hypothetical protein
MVSESPGLFQQPTLHRIREYKERVMRVALIGGTGFVGSHLVDQLVQSGIQPVVLVRPASGARLRLAEASGRRKLMLPAPAIGIAAAAILLDRFDVFPITRDQLRMPLQGNECNDDALCNPGLQAKPFDRAHLAYLKTTPDASTPCRKNAA